MEQRESEERAKLEWLRSVVREGVEDLERGDYTALRSQGGIDAFMNEIHDEVVAKERALRRRRQPDTPDAR